MSTNTTERPISGWLGSGKASAGRVVVSIVTILLLSNSVAGQAAARVGNYGLVSSVSAALEGELDTQGADGPTLESPGVPEDVQSALLDALRRVPETGSRAERHYSVGVYYDHAKWAMGTIGAWIEGEGPNWADSPWFLVRRYESGWVTVVLQSAPEFRSILDTIPPSEMDTDLRAELLGESTHSKTGNAVALKWPWKEGQTWQITRWHDDQIAIDFSTGSPSPWLISAASAFTTIKCESDVSNETWIKQTTDVGVFIYGHLDISPEDRDPFRGKNVAMGTPFGLPYDGNENAGWYKKVNGIYKSCTEGEVGCGRYKWKNKCGIGTGKHIHWNLPSHSLTIDGWTGQGNHCLEKNGKTYCDRKVPGLTSSNSPPGSSDQTPTISFVAANGIVPAANELQTNQPNWSFSGSANDDTGVSEVWLVNKGVQVSKASTSNGWSNWSHAATLNGINEIRFRVYDSASQQQTSEFIRLLIDTLPPNTSPQLVGLRGENDWYRTSVQVRLAAIDVASSGWASDVGSVSWRVDSGALQTATGPVADFQVGGNGSHTVEYYAEDKVGNREAIKTLLFKIDATPPAVPGTPVNAGVGSGVWQKENNDPYFTWSSSSDIGSGIVGYLVSWDGSTQPVNTTIFDPPSVRTGSHVLRVSAVDRAGNQSEYTAPFLFNYDGTPPSMPSPQHSGASDGVWQNRTRIADFAWPIAADAGSGTQQYYVYWGPELNGVSGVPTSSRIVSSTTPITVADSAVEWYLRTRSEDVVGLMSDWATFRFRYDGAIPTVTVSANYGLTIAHSTLVNINVRYGDTGSGVDAMRFSTEGQTWSDWKPATSDITWEIPNVGRRSYTLYAQVKDVAGNASSVVSDTVFLNTNVDSPRSLNYQIWNGEFTGGGGELVSPDWQQRVTLGLNFGAPIGSASAHYVLGTGLQAAQLGVPTATTTATIYLITNQILASGGTSANGLTSTAWSMHGTLGQATDMRPMSSLSYRAQLGYWSGISPLIVTSSVEPPPVTSTVNLDCEFYSLSLNQAALFTNLPLVNVNACGPNPTQLMLSNDGGFGGAIWQPYTHTVPWYLTTYGNYVLPRTVYARFRDSAGQMIGPIQDDIIFDPVSPYGNADLRITSLFGPAAFAPDTMSVGDELRLLLLPERVPKMLPTSAETQTLYLVAADDTSGVVAMQIGFEANLADAVWIPFSAITPVTLSIDGIYTVYVRFRDNANNISPAQSLWLVRDSTPPAGSIRLANDIVGAKEPTATVLFTATDNLSGLTELRVSQYPGFTDTVWAQYRSEMATPLLSLGGPTSTLYAQFRDAAGNESSIVQTVFRIDSTPPQADPKVAYTGSNTVTIRFYATDDLSGLAEVKLSPDHEFITRVVRIPYTATIDWDMSLASVVYLQFTDVVGNVSEPYWVGATDDAPQFFELYLPLVRRDATILP